MDTNSIENEYGKIFISDDVLCQMAICKALEIDGVVAMSLNVVNEFTTFLGIKAPTQGIKLTHHEGQDISLNIYIVAKHGYRVPDVALKVQEHIKSCIEACTYFTVLHVNVYVQDIIID